MKLKVTGNDSIQCQGNMLQRLFTMYFSSISFEQIVSKFRNLCHLGLLILLPPHTDKQTNKNTQCAESVGKQERNTVKLTKIF